MGKARSWYSVNTRGVDDPSFLISWYLLPLLLNGVSLADWYKHGHKELDLENSYLRSRSIFSYRHIAPDTNGEPIAFSLVLCWSTLMPPIFLCFLSAPPGSPRIGPDACEREFPLQHHRCFPPTASPTVARPRALKSTDTEEAVTATLRVKFAESYWPDLLVLYNVHRVHSDTLLFSRHTGQGTI